MRHIQVTDIDFGDIDARSEILARDPERRKLFLDSFYVPSTVSLHKLVAGDRYLLVGPKGSGKTAFLRYLQNHLAETTEGASRFIVFRDDVTEQDRDKLVSLSQVRIYENGSTKDEDDKDMVDCSTAWQLFIHREIAHTITKNPDLCGLTPEIGGYLKLVNQFFAGFKTHAFKRLIQRITKGKIRIAALGQGIEAEAEFVDKHGNVDVSEFVRYCNGAITALHFNSLNKNARINIFFDEVNITYVSGVGFRRDSILVRDLVAACGIMNSLFAEHQIPIYIYTAIRSEVVDSVEGSVRELQKWVDDKAIHINWIVPNLSHGLQPLIGLLRQRIYANAQRLSSRKLELKDIDLSEYFSDPVFNLKYDAFLIYETWGRPRDLVRLLSLAVPHVGRDGRFSSASFDASFANYSRSCWEEKQDELSAKYSQSEIQAIKRFLTKFRANFSRHEVDARISYQSSNDSRSNHFFSGRNVDVLLEDLFRVGVLGNAQATKAGSIRPVYSYTGYTNFNGNDQMCVHRSLWRELVIGTGQSPGELAAKLRQTNNRGTHGAMRPK